MREIRLQAYGVKDMITQRKREREITGQGKRWSDESKGETD